MAKSNRNIKTNSSKVVCTETSIELSDEKMKNMLSRTYEKARTDAEKKKWYDYNDVCFSIASSLFVTLLTSEFKSFSVISGEHLTVFAWGVFAVSFITGLISAGIKSANHNKNIHNERDDAIQEVLEEIMSEDNL